MGGRGLGAHGRHGGRGRGQEEGVREARARRGGGEVGGAAPLPPVAQRGKGRRARGAAWGGRVGGGERVVVVVGEGCAAPLPRLGVPRGV